MSRKALTKAAFFLFKIQFSLGRWVHYQRVEYWIFQQKGTAKITEERIARLNSIGFEWDPQKAQWEKMFAKLKEVRKKIESGSHFILRFNDS